jgi:phosphatidylinositol-bisphosphatase
MDLSKNLNYINNKLELLEEKFTKTVPVRIFCGTFNVNGKIPDENLRPWLCAPSPDSKPIDIYALGFQELVDLNTKSLLLNADANDRETYWVNILDKDMLNENNFRGKIRYKMLTKIRMFGLFLIIYVNESLIAKNYIKEVYLSSVACGILDFVGNKGSVGVSMKIHESRVCFVCSHLAADTDKLEKRNADFRATRQKLLFQNDPNNLNSYLDIENDHQTIFWFGDLNYRLENLTLNETFRLIFSCQFDELIKFDQLSNERIMRRVFEGYSEGKINFRPTYKYTTRTDFYEKQHLYSSSTNSSGSPSSSTTSITTSSSSTGISYTSSESDLISLNTSQNSFKVKLPSWTDRVLFKSNLKLEQLKYSSENSLTLSDHKPVYSIFELNVKKFDQKAKDKLYDELLKESDRRVNEEMPRISIKNYELKFQECMYYDAKTLSLQIKNDGQNRSNVDVFFYLDQNSSNNTNSPKQWVKIHPNHKERLKPGETYTVELTTCFNYSHLTILNKKKQLDDFLILRCLNGNDLFVTLSCNYKPTIIGFSLKALSTLVGLSFDSCNQDVLIDSIETQIIKHEEDCDLLFRQTMKQMSIESQFDNVEKMICKNKILILFN